MTRSPCSPPTDHGRPVGERGDRVRRGEHHGLPYRGHVTQVRAGVSGGLEEARASRSLSGGNVRSQGHHFGE